MIGKKGKGWFLAVLACLAVLTVLVGRQISLGYRTPLSCCVADSGTGGGRGLALWAERMGWPVRPLRQPLWEAVELLQPATGSCVLTAGDGSWSPWGESLSSEQWESISRWVRRGNTLLLLTTAPDQLPGPVAKDLKRAGERKPAGQVKESVGIEWSQRK